MYSLCRLFELLLLGVFLALLLVPGQDLEERQHEIK